MGMLTSILRIGFVGFGGGSALIPVIEKAVVEEDHLLRKKEYDKDVIVASITPGALPVEIATGLGMHGGKISEMIAAALCMAFPGAFFTVLLISVLAGLNHVLMTQIECLSIGITAFICCMLTDYTKKTLREARKESKGRFHRALLILAGVFLLTCWKNIFKLFGINGSPFFSLSTLQTLGIAFFGILYTHCKFTKKNVSVSGVLIALYLFADSGSAQWSIALSWCVKAAMLVLAVRGLYRSIVKDGAKKKTVPWQPMAKRVSAWILFTVVLSVPAAVVCWDTIPFLGNGWLSSLLSFGGGDAYLTVASGIFVDTGAVDSSDFYGHLAPIVNAMPGSILCKVLSGVGYYIGYDATGGMTGGYLVALAGFSCSLAASGSVFCIVYYIYECFEKLDVFRLISRWIRPIIAGLLLSLILSLVYQNTQTAVKLESSVPVILGITVFIYAIDQLLLYKWKKKNGILILFSGIASLLLCNLAIYFQAV